MRHWFAAMMICLLLPLAACTSMQSSFAYTAADPQALLVHETDGNSYFIRPLNWDERTVGNGEHALGNGVSIYSTYMAGYGVKRLPPGVYAITNSLTPPDMFGRYWDTCFEDAAPAFRISAGALNVIPAFKTIVTSSDYTRGRELRLVQELVKGYPGITAPVRYAEFLGYVDFSPPESLDLVENSCGSGSTFEFLGRSFPQRRR